MLSSEIKPGQNRDCSAFTAQCLARWLTVAAASASLKSPVTTAVVSSATPSERSPGTCQSGTKCSHCMQQRDGML